MNNKTVIYIVLGLALLIGVVLTLNKTGKKRYQWYKTMQTDKKQPYNLGVIHNLLKVKAAHFDEVNKDLPGVLQNMAGSDTPVTYVFVGEYIYLNREDIEALLTFASGGNHVFIAAESMPDSLIYNLTYASKMWYIKHTVRTAAQVNFFHEQLKRRQPYRFVFRQQQDTVDALTEWSYISENNTADDYLPSYYEYDYGLVHNYAKISYIDSNKINFIRMPYGNGSVWYHTNPLLFTNYFMLDTNGFEHADKVLSHMPLSHVIWDEGSRHYKSDSQNFAHKEDSPLSYILKQPALTWAWYILVTMALLFLVFRSKREQRVIPVLEKNTNTTLQFLDTMSGMFFKSGNHHNIAEMRMANFLWFIRNKLGISTQQADDKTYALIAVKSKVPEDVVKTIFEYYHQVIKDKQIDEEQLIKLHQLIASFYKQYYKR